jgi:hypothetical protein
LYGEIKGHQYWYITGGTTPGSWLFFLSIPVTLPTRQDETIITAAALKIIRCTGRVHGKVKENKTIECCMLFLSIPCQPTKQVKQQQELLLHPAVYNERNAIAGR